MFLDVSQALDKVWHKGLINKPLINQILPKQYVELTCSYVNSKLFRIKQEKEYPDNKE